jgi:hypothetical protein
MSFTVSPTQSKFSPRWAIPSLEISAQHEQSYGDAAREMIANWSEQLAWLAPAPDTHASRIIAPTAVVAPSPDLAELKTMSLGLAIVRQDLDQLIASQGQMAREITKLQATEQDVLQTISEPLPRSPAAPTP